MFASSQRACCSGFRSPRRPAQQVFESGSANERVALEIEKHVSRRRLREAAEALSFDDPQDFVARRAGVSPLKLNPGLLADPLIGFRRSAVRPAFKRKRKLCQRRQRINAPAPKLIDLKLGYPGHKAEVVIGAAAPVAFLPPTANLTMRYGVRVCIACAESPVYGRLKLALHQPMIGKKVVDSESEGLEVVTWNDDVHILREDVLNTGEQA